MNLRSIKAFAHLAALAASATHDNQTASGFATQRAYERAKTRRKMARASRRANR
jgi:hypothetical protein